MRVYLQTKTTGYPLFDTLLSKHFRNYKREQSTKHVPAMVKAALRTVFLTESDYRRFDEYGIIPFIPHFTSS